MRIHIDLRGRCVLEIADIDPAETCVVERLDQFAGEVVKGHHGATLIEEDNEVAVVGHTPLEHGLIEIALTSGAIDGSRQIELIARTVLHGPAQVVPGIRHAPARHRVSTDQHGVVHQRRWHVGRPHGQWHQGAHGARLELRRWRRRYLGRLVRRLRG
ncbi:hypothetical protein CKO36_17780 [Rhabdochromatium marinum]|nr:hypothetical protein [Rhabdochromatium marinum]